MKFLVICFIDLLFLIFLFDNLKSQETKGFSDNPDVFFEDLFSFIAKKDRQLSKELQKKFENYWQNYYTPEEKKIIIEISNALYKRNALAVPHFELWIRLLIICGKKNFDKTFLNEIFNSLFFLINQKQTTLYTIKDFIETMFFFVKDRNLYNSENFRWQINNLKNCNLKFYGNKLKLIAQNVNLVCKTEKDSTVIYNTNGEYNFFEKIWIGNEGKITWERLGEKQTDVFVRLKKYRLELTKTYFEIDSVYLTHKVYFRDEILGKVIEKVFTSIDEEKINYPQFISYTKRFKLRGIFEGMNYEGGFTLKGNKFYGSGSPDEPAKIYIYYKDTLKFLLKSTLFVFKSNGIVSDNASATIYIESDSIYHSNLVFKFNFKTKEVTFIRTGEGMTRNLFYDTYHKLEIDAPYVVWEVGSPMIFFKPIPGATNKVVKFASFDYFSRENYLRLQGLAKKNPLQYLRDLYKKNNSRYFNENELANLMKLSKPQTRQLLFSLSFMGFILYNPETGLCEITDKTFFYLDANVGKKDYDAIYFESEVVGNDYNAMLSFLDNNLKLKGVKEVVLSDSQNVIIFPKDQEMIVKKNRNIQFSGKVMAGMLLFDGSNFDFLYDSYKILLNDINYIKMQIRTNEKDKYGNYIIKRIASVIENGSGILLIEDPKNKSSSKKLSQYPIFISQKESYVYYEYPFIFNNVYKKGKFYFQIYPYTLDSLNDLTKKNVAFNGLFVSGGIFKPLEEVLTVQPDYSLGFIHKTPPTGYNIYGNKGIYKNTIFLSHKGLRGEGELEYLSSITVSKDFIFFPDSTITIAENFIVEKRNIGVEYPSVNGENIKIKWEPYNDVLIAENIKKPFDIFDDQAKFLGKLYVQPNGLEGNGKLDFVNAELYSNKMTFGEHVVKADTSNFNLKESGAISEFAFKTFNVKANIDFKQRIGEFVNNGEGSYIEFPKNLYIAYMDKFVWYMDKEEIALTTPTKSSEQQKNIKSSDNLSLLELEDLQLEGTKFISLHPEQDSLWFVSPFASYNVKQHIISANDVKYLRVADATIYPIDGKVVVEKNAVMQTLKDATIVANNITKYHTIYNALVNIYGRKRYSASGFYDYIDENENKQTIKFDVVSVDTSFQTYAKGKIGFTDNFMLSPKFGFTGDVLLLANEQYLTFDGYFLISHECNELNRYWTKFKAVINPKEIYIPIEEELIDINNKKLYVGLLMQTDTFSIYPAFFTPSKGTKDVQIFKAKGYLTFDKTEGKYKISHKDKLQEFNMPGNYLSLHHTICNLYNEGVLNLAVNTGHLKVKAYGSSNYDVLANDIEFNVILTINFFFEKSCLNILYKEIQKSYGLEPIDFTKNSFVKGLYELLGEKKTNELLTEFSLGKFRRVPAELDNSFTFFDVTLKWNNKTNSYIADTLLGLGLITDNYLNVKVPGYLEIVKKKGGDKFYLYLQPNENSWYFFYYNNNLLQVISSNEEFNNIIKSLKPENRKLKTKSKDEPPFSFALGSITEVKNFKMRMQKILSNVQLSE